MLEACGNHVAKLVEQVAYTHKEKRRGIEVQWATLQQVLAADPRATSTYAKIVEWISNKDVDVLQKCQQGVYHRCARAKERPGHEAVIENRPAFLDG